MSLLSIGLCYTPFQLPQPFYEVMIAMAIMVLLILTYVYVSHNNYLSKGFKSEPSAGARDQGAVSIRKTVLPGMAIPMLKIRRPNGRLIFNMEIAIRR